MSEHGLKASLEKMRSAGLPEVAVDNFAYYYERLVDGDRGALPESQIEPVEEVPDADALSEPGDEVRGQLDRTVVVKLNGGLGTSMGMTRAKALLEVKDGLSFLDITARQVLE